MHIAMIGLGRMGMNMTKRLLGGDHKISVYDRSEDMVNEAVTAGAIASSSVEGLIATLPSPRIVWLMVPSGKPVDALIDTLSLILQDGDVVIDGGNSFFRDSVRRASFLKKKKIQYLDVGTSGGIWGLKEGYCLMAGGERETYDLIEPVLKTLAPPEGCMYVGAQGAGHFVKMIHNGIEYAMMESYAEGFELLKKSEYGDELDLSSLSALWNRGSVIRSWLLELLEEAFKKEGDLASIKPYVEDSGEGRWTVLEAIEGGVAVPGISNALFRRFRSRDADPFAEKVLAALRAEFGGHAVKKAR